MSPSAFKRLCPQFLNKGRNTILEAMKDDFWLTRARLARAED